MIAWIEWAITLLLALSQPLWKSVFALSPAAGADVSPAVLCLVSGAALCSFAGLLIALPQFARLPRAVWSGWSTGVQKERTPSLPDLSEPLLGVVYAPLFNPRTVHAGRMLVRGMDSTAALASCLCALLVCAAQVASSITGDSPARLLPFAALLFASLAAWSISVLAAVRTIRRSDAGKTLPADFSRSPAWLWMIPLMLFLYGLSSALLPVLSLRLDQTPVHGFTAVFYAFIRSLLLVVVQYLLLHAPAKLALLLAPKKPHLEPWIFYATSGFACFVWLTIDSFHPIF
ncbi:MAG: hypothetical protein LLF75_08370 [Eubacteriales bacterium]|nr:hypothetical protein [Eubacteriales bacterium]